MSTAFNGRWKLYESENYDEFLAAVNVSWLMRQIAKSLKPELEWTVNDNKIRLKVITPMKKTDQEFELGVPFDELLLDGTTIKTLVTKESDTKLLHVTQDGENEVRTTQEVVGDNLVQTIEPVGKNVKAVRKFKLVQ